MMIQSIYYYIIIYISLTTDLEDIINEKIIEGTEDDSKTRYSKDV